MKNIYLVIFLLLSCISSSILDRKIVGKWYAISMTEKENVVHNGNKGSFEISFDFNSNSEVVIKQGESVKKDIYQIKDSMLIFPNRTYFIQYISKDTMKVFDSKNDFDKNFYYFLKNK